MLARKNRLTRAEFTEHFKTGNRFHSPLFTLVFAPSARFKASAVASKKVIKGAVGRNKFRRRVYAVFETAQREKPIHGIYICIAKAGAGTASFDAIRTDITSLIHKTGLIR